MFQVEEILLAEHQTGEMEKFLQPSGGLRAEGNPTTEGFDSNRTIEKKPVGMSALTSLSGGNPISGMYRHFSE